MEAEEFLNITRLEEGYWRYVGARELVKGYVDTISADGELAILDAGCGTGRTLAELDDHRGYGLDFSFDALRLARVRSRGLVRAGVCEIPCPDRTFDVVISQDVLYHLAVASDAQALTEFCRVLRPGGLLLLNLPAFESLRSSHDAIAYTRRRYRRAEVGEKLAGAGFTIRVLSYWNCLLFPLAAVLRLAQRFGGSQAASDLRPLPVAVNRLFTALLRFENSWLLRGWRLPWGLSVFAVAERSRDA